MKISYKGKIYSDENSSIDVVSYLNSILSKDSDAINDLFSARVKCNLELANDDTFQVRQISDNEFNIGVLGLLNGIFGKTPNGERGIIQAILDDDGRIIKFK